MLSNMQKMVRKREQNGTDGSKAGTNELTAGLTGRNALSRVRVSAAVLAAPYTFQIPKGLRIKAQGCEERATLGIEPTSQQTLKGFRRPISTIKIRVRFSAHADWKSATRQTGSLLYGVPSEDVCTVQVAATLCRRSPYDKGTIGGALTRRRYKGGIDLQSAKLTPS